MAFDSNPHRNPVARELHDARAELRGIHDQLWEMNQPPEVRAALQAKRAERARRAAWAARLVLGLAAGWVVRSLAFGRAGQRLFGGVLSFALDALGVLLVVGFFVWIGGSVWRGARWVAGRSEGRR